MTDSPTWERLPSDTDKSYQAFCVYRDMGANRSLAKTVDKLGKKSGYGRVLEKWSSAHDWVNRCSDYDDYQDSLRHERNIQRQKLIEDNAYGDYEFLRLAIEKHKGDYMSIEFKKISPREIGDLVGMMKQADDYARRAVGLPDKIAQSKTEVSGPDGGAIIIQTGMDLGDL